MKQATVEKIRAAKAAAIEAYTAVMAELEQGGEFLSPSAGDPVLEHGVDVERELDGAMTELAACADLLSKGSRFRGFKQTTRERVRKALGYQR